MPAADDPLRELRSATGQTLEELSFERPQLVVFLRHFGCTFCRESLSDLVQQRQNIQQHGIGITLVHMSDTREALEFFDSFGLTDISSISDPECRLYRMFGLDHGGVRELFGLKVWARGVTAGLFGGHGIGKVRGNAFQMPGVYIMHGGKLITGFQHRQASDRPDYIALIQRSFEKKLIPNTQSPLKREVSVNEASTVLRAASL